MDGLPSGYRPNVGVCLINSDSQVCLSFFFSSFFFSFFFNVFLNLKYSPCFSSLELKSSLLCFYMCVCFCSKNPCWICMFKSGCWFYRSCFSFYESIYIRVIKIIYWKALLYDFFYPLEFSEVYTIKDNLRVCLRLRCYGF